MSPWSWPGCSSACPASPWALIGFSLGGNTLAQVSGRKGRGYGRSSRPPLSPRRLIWRRIADSFENGEGRRYAARFLRFAAAQGACACAPNGDVSMSIVSQCAQTCVILTMPLPRRCMVTVMRLNTMRPTAASHYLDGIAVDTLVMRAMDDPFFANDIPHALWPRTIISTPALTTNGGHVAFAEGRRRASSAIGPNGRRRVFWPSVLHK